MGDPSPKTCPGIDFRARRRTLLKILRGQIYLTVFLLHISDLTRGFFDIRILFALHCNKKLLMFLMREFVEMDRKRFHRTWIFCLSDGFLFYSIHLFYRTSHVMLNEYEWSVLKWKYVCLCMFKRERQSSFIMIFSVCYIPGKAIASTSV